MECIVGDSPDLLDIQVVVDRVGRIFAAGVVTQFARARLFAQVISEES